MKIIQEYIEYSILRQVKVMCFESTDDIVRHLEGDESVKPAEEVDLLGCDG